MTPDACEGRGRMGPALARPMEVCGGMQGNLWVQPVLAQHGDILQPNICFFAQRNIPPWTELTYDYGWQYVDENLEVHCSAAPPLPQQRRLHAQWTAWLGARVQSLHMERSPVAALCWCEPIGVW